MKETKERSKKVKKEKVRGKVKNMKEEKIRSAGSIFEGCLCLSIFYSIFAVISVSKLDQSIYSFKTGIL